MLAVLFCTLGRTSRWPRDNLQAAPAVRRFFFFCFFFNETWSWSNCKYAFQRKIMCNDHFQMPGPVCVCVSVCSRSHVAVRIPCLIYSYKWFAALLSNEYQAEAGEWQIKECNEALWLRSEPRWIDMNWCEPALKHLQRHNRIKCHCWITLHLHEFKFCFILFVVIVFFSSSSFLGSFWSSVRLCW